MADDKIADAVSLEAVFFLLASKNDSFFHIIAGNNYNEFSSIPNTTKSYQRRSAIKNITNNDCWLQLRLHNKEQLLQ